MLPFFVFVAFQCIRNRITNFPRTKFIILWLFRPPPFPVHSKPSTSASFRVSSQPMKALDIPPYRKNQLVHQPSASPPPSSKVSEIPAFKTRKSNDWQPTSIDSTNPDFQQMQLPSAVSSDLLRRLKNSDPTEHVRRSIDSIAAQAKADANASSAAGSTPTATSSWSNVAQRSESLTSNSGVGLSSSKKASIDDETKGESIEVWSFLVVEFIFLAIEYMIIIMNVSTTNQIQN